MTLEWVTGARAAMISSVLAAVIYLGALGNGFAYDDVVLVAGDPGIQQLEGLVQRLGRPSWPGSFGEQVGGWRPVTTAVWAFTWAVGDGSPFAFHLMGVVAHAGVTALVALLILQLMGPLGALAGGLVFAVHPVHVEAVANIAGTAEPLAALFALSAVWLHSDGRERHSLLRTVGIVALYLLGVLAKEGVAVLPLLLLVLDATRIHLDPSGVERLLRARGRTYAGMFAGLTLVLWARSLVVGGVTTASTPSGASVLTEIPRVWTVMSSWPHYLRLLLFPADLSADYGPDVIPVAFGWTLQVWLGLLIGLGVMVLALTLWRVEPDTDRVGRSPRLVSAGMLWAVAALLPVANILYLGPVLVAERTLYLSSVGVSMVAGWVFVRLAGMKHGRAVPALALVVVLGGARTVTRVPSWESTETVMTRLLEDHPESGRAWFAFGQRLMAADRPAEALKAFSLGIGLLNSEYKESTEVASHLMSMGRPDAARLFLERAWREEPEWPTAPGLLASVELSAGNVERAETAARAAVSLQRENGSLHHLLAEALSRQGRHSEAIEYRRSAIDAGLGVRIRPWFLLVVEYMNVADTSGALAALDSAALRVQAPEEEEALSQMRAAVANTPQPSNDLEPS